MVGVFTPVSVFVTSIDAAATAAPLESVMVPVIVPFALCEKTATGIDSKQSVIAMIRMYFPLYVSDGSKGQQTPRL
jgi:hypothetical protein